MLTDEVLIVPLRTVCNNRAFNTPAASREGQGLPAPTKIPQQDWAWCWDPVFGQCYIRLWLEKSPSPGPEAQGAEFCDLGVTMAATGGQRPPLQK